MIHRTTKEKEEAIKLRKSGKSLRFIESRLNIPKSTLNGWFRGLILSKSASNRIEAKRLRLLSQGRVKAVKWHNLQKSNRLKLAYQEATKLLYKIQNKDQSIIELALSLLYLGEGSKKQVGLALGNSDPLILQFYILILRNIYQIPLTKLRAELHLRADQNAVQLIRYWSKQLDLPIQNFYTVTHDYRTEGKPTYSSYHGVCLIRCGYANLQRKLIFLSRMYCESIIKKYKGT